MNIFKHIFCKDICFIINEYIMISKNEVFDNKNDLLTDLLTQFEDFDYISPFKIMYKSSVKQDATITKYIRFIKGLARYRKNKGLYSL